MTRLSRHGGGFDAPQQRQPGQGIGSRPGANGPAGWQPQFRNDLASGGSVTAAIQAERARQGLGNGMQVSLPDPSRNGGVVGPGRQGNPGSAQDFAQGIRNQLFGQQFSGPAFQQGPASRGFQNMQGQMGQSKPDWSGGQQMAQSQGGRNGLGNPFNNPYGDARRGGYNFDRK